MQNSSLPLLLGLSHFNYPSRSPVIRDLSLKIRENELSIIYGNNGSGKSLLGNLIAGKIPVPAAETQILPESVQLISLDRQKEILDDERRNDDSDLLQRQDFGTITGDYLQGWETDNHVREMEESIHLDNFISTGLKFLSSGEFRKVMILKSLLAKTKLIILDNPLEGLDLESSQSLLDLISRIQHYCSCLILCADPERFLSLPARFLTLNEGKLEDGLPDLNTSAEIHIPSFHRESEDRNNPVLIEMKEVNLSYYGKPVLTRINWKCLESETWHICGPNGSGKTTLLSLINGDNPRAYACDISLFGKQKGSGESVWEIKRPIGYMSPALLLDYRVDLTVMNLLLSGFHDSIGLYEKPGLNEIKKAREWLRCLNRENLENESFHSQSEGTQRLLLIIRAFIKNPRLLILDEPCQGLDKEAANAVMLLVDAMASGSKCAILYVSHDPRRIPSSLAKRLNLIPHKEGGYTSFIEEI